MIEKLREGLSQEDIDEYQRQLFIKETKQRYSEVLRLMSKAHQAVVGIIVLFGDEKRDQSEYK